MLIAMTRAVSPSIDRCELEHLQRQTIDFEQAQRQHHQYESCLRELGCMIHRLPAEPDLPDSVFVEDTAIVLDELAIITRPGADSRKPETISIAKALENYRKLHYIQSPGTIDGGDVLKIGKTIYIGLSGRTNQNAIDQIRVLVEPYGYGVTAVHMTGCLHLKSAVTQVTPDTLLVNKRWFDNNAFPDMRLLDVAASEPYGANSLLIGDRLIYPSNYPETAIRLASLGIRIMTVDVSELIKAEGAVTCCSVVFCQSQE
jgi:dimethylargininase